MKKIYIFSSQKCKACQSLKMMLEEQQIPFIEIDKNNPNCIPLWNQIVLETNSIALPMLFIQEEDGSEGTAYTADVDWTTHEDLIEIIKRNI